MNYFKIIFRLFSNFQYPDNCIICTTNLDSWGDSVCKDCWELFVPTNLDNWISSVTNNKDIDAAWSGWYFDKEIQKVIHSLKYNERAKLGIEIGRKLGEMITSDCIGRPDVLLPVPLHPVKKRIRGFNQSEWIANGISQVWRIPYQGSILIRNKYTESQTILSTEERIDNMSNAFRLNGNVEGLHIAIIDDVLTTGSTISACAEVLKKHGAGFVSAVTCGTPRAG